MPRYLKICIWSLCGLAALLALCTLLVAQFNWNLVKPWINARASQLSGRPVAIQGPLTVEWHQSGAKSAGWQGWIPQPRITANDVLVGNPAWMTSGTDMARVGQVRWSLNPAALLDKKIAVRELYLNGPVLNLQRDRAGRNNWGLTTSTAGSAWRVAVDGIAINNARVHLVDAVKHANLTLLAGPAPDSASDSGTLAWTLSGSLDKDAVHGKGHVGALGLLQQVRVPYPVDANVHIGKTSVAFKGTLSNPGNLAALDAQLRVSGVSMAKLYALTGIPFPETPAFSLNGRLTGDFQAGASKWLYEKFDGKLGSSDLSGTIEYQARQPRPYLKAALVSKLLRFEDLAPLIGADSAASKHRRDAPLVQPANKVLPVEPFKTDRWRSIDAEVQFTGRKILGASHLPISNMVAALRLQDGTLSLQPLNFGLAGGNLVSNVVLDGRGKTVMARLTVSARHLKLKKLLPAYRALQASLGEINGDASLSATGNSIAALLGSSNGEVKAYIDGGSVSKLLLEEIGLNIDTVILTRLTGDTQLRLNCMASDFAVARGVMQVRHMVVDTEDALLATTGQIDLAREQLALTMKPQMKTLRLVSLRAPFYVSGSFKSPSVKVDKGVLALKAGAVVALAVTAPVLMAVLPLVNLGKPIESDCDKLLRDVRKKPVAPAPGVAVRTGPTKKSQG
jgi:AsmA family protein